MPLVTTQILKSIKFNSISPETMAGLSSDGRLVAFFTYDANKKGTLFVQDLDNGTTKQIALPNSAVSARSPSFSGDGNKLAFSAGWGQAAQIYTVDLRSNQVQLASTDARGVAISGGNLDSSFSLSSDGRFLAFSSDVNHLVAGDNNGFFDIFLKDLTTGALSLVSTNTNGDSGNSGSRDLFFTQDDRYIIFSSIANNLVGLGNSKEVHLFKKDLTTGVLSLVSSDVSGNPVGVHPLASDAFMVFADDTKLLFFSYEDYYLKDLVNGSLTKFFEKNKGEDTLGSIAGLSSDGRHIIFYSNKFLGFQGDADGYYDLYRKDLKTGAVELLTPHSPTNPGVTSTGSRVIQVSDDGKTVLFLSDNNSIFGVEDLIGRLPLPVGTSIYVSRQDGLLNLQGNDGLFGTTGADQLAGGVGDDSYWINNASDTIIEASNGGKDLAFSLLANYTLPGNVENLVIGLPSGVNAPLVSNANGTGNDLNNQITGNSEANVLRGLGGDDIITGAAGADTIDGGAGFDIANYNHWFSEGDAIVKTAGGTQVKTNFAVDLLQNIERIQFADSGFALKGDAHAAQAYRIYQAAFNRTPDQAGLGYWIGRVDHGAKLDDIARGFMQSAEFKNLYGSAPSNTLLVEKFYQNVLHRAPDAGGLKYWVDLLNGQHSTPAHVLVEFSESPENQAALVGVIDAGFWFKLPLQ